MVNAYIGQIFMYGFNWAPKNYQTCSAQILSIAQNQALFSILGTTYGGNGVQTFALPDLRGRTYIGTGQGPGLSSYVLGEVLGSQAVTLQPSNMAPHNHQFNVNSTAATSGVPSPSVVLSQGPVIGGSAIPMYSTSAANGTMNAGELSTTSGGQALSILQPYLSVNFSICLFGIFPTRN